jgi:diguanylate cyclase (GGDEF)-like protein
LTPQVCPQHPEEYRQARARVVVSGLALVVCLIAWLQASAETAGRTLVTVWLVAAYLLFSLAWTLVVRCSGRGVAARRFAAIGADVGMTTFAAYMLGEFGAGFYPLYLWIVVGNGTRFGPRYLYAALGGAAAAFAALLFWSPYWRQQLPIGISLMVGLCVLPLFYANLIEGLHAANHDLVVEKQELLRTREQLHELAMRDSLTGLWNRRTVLERLTLELERTRRQARPLAILLADVDHFKTVNDIYGHQAGDTVLAEVASRLLAELRPYDIVGRYGGEELILVLPGVGRDVALECANRLREAVALPIRLPNQVEVSVTCSFGLLTVSSSELLPTEHLIRLADDALYAAKRRGRNRVEEAAVAAT